MNKMSDKEPWESLTATEIEAFVRAIDSNGQAELSIELGRFVTSWASLELAVLTMLKHLAPSSRQIDFSIFTGSMDIYEKFRAVTAIASLYPMPDEWKSSIKDLSGFVTGKLREERNRLIHDTWLIEGGKFTRIYFTTRLPKGDQPLSIVDTTPVTAGEIRETCARITLVGLHLKRLCDQFDASIGDISRPQE